MAAISAQIYSAGTNPLPDDRAKPYLSTSARSRTQESMTSGSRWRFNRSNTNLREPERSPSVTSATTRTPKIERTTSKMSLFNLFSRPKVEKARGHTEVGLAVPMRPQTPPRSTAPSSAPRSSLRQNPSPPAQQTIRARSSQMFRQSMRPTTPSLTEFGTWEPPPLFQAFPQSLKHATVQACVFPPEVLMRTQSQRRQAEMLRERMDSARDLSTIAENETEAKKLEKTHRRLVSNSVLNPPAPELVNKIYILVTAGYVLQYAGDGAFDRTPEKVLKLGKDSAAFACDLIPGKHWVLQISSHAHNDGTIDSGPKSSLLSRLRSQNNATKRAAASFLLVLESAEEMDAWMTVVRKEIDTLGGVKPKDHSERSSSSIDSFSEKKSVESFSHRYLIQRDPTRVSNVGPVDSPQQPSQHAVLPKVVSLEWDGNRSDLALNVAEISGAVSARGCHSRQSNEMSSVASTPVSQHHAQLDQIRGRSRFSFMSSTTTTSGVLTQNTSRDSSPAPHSPLKEEFSTSGETEPLRSAMSLKSFHMNPANSSASRRRSMQPLPVTNEDFPALTKTPAKKQRHSLCSPTSPTMPELGRRFTDSTTVPPSNTTTSKTPASGSTSVDPVAGTSVVLKKLSVSDGAHQLDPAQEYTREDSPLRYSMRNFSAPPRFGTISPPPREPAPLPPKTARRQSILNLPPPSTAQNLHLNTSTMTETRLQRRLSSTPKPFLRPLPVRPQDGSMIIPRRQSSLAPTSAPAPLPLGINVGRSVTAPVRFENSAPSKTLGNQGPRMSLSAQSSQSIRRPTSVQIRADAAPFLASTRPARVISSTPSFLPGRRASNVPTSAPRPHVATQPTPSIDALRQQALAQQTENKAILPRRSLPAMNLPPPAPPPNMALPPLPPNVSAPTPPPSVPLPSLPISLSAPTPPPSIPLPTPPPSLPIPPVPTSTQTKVVIV